MQPTEILGTSCPCCGEAIELMVDCSLAEQTYTEDCQVCCQPMVVAIRIDDREAIHLEVQPENC